MEERFGIPHWRRRVLLCLSYKVGQVYPIGLEVWYTAWLQGRSAILKVLGRFGLPCRCLGSILYLTGVGIFFVRHRWWKGLVYPSAVGEFWYIFMILGRFGIPFV